MEKAKKWMEDHGKEICGMLEHLQISSVESIQRFCLLMIDEKHDDNLPKEEPKEPKTEKLIQRLEILADEIKDLKEGRVLSGKNLKLVKDCREQIRVVEELLDKLISATEPPKEESVLPLITEAVKEDKSNGELGSLTQKDIPIVVEEVLKGLQESMLEQRKEMQQLIDHKRGKIA